MLEGEAALSRSMWDRHSCLSRDSLETANKNRRKR